MFFNWFEILGTSVQNSENALNSRKRFEKRLGRRVFFETKLGYEVACVKILRFC